LTFAKINLFLLRTSDTIFTESLPQIKYNLLIDTMCSAAVVYIEL